MARVARAAAPRRRGRITAVIIAVVLIPLLVLGASVAWFFWQLDAHGIAGQGGARCNVEPGWGVPRIGEELAARARDRLVARVQRLRALQRRQLVPGRHLRPAQEHGRDATRSTALKTGPQIDYVKLTVPPGLWLKQIAARVGKLPGRSAQAVPRRRRATTRCDRRSSRPACTNLEGLLWPDTYKISSSQDEISILPDDGDRRSTRTRTKLGLATANVDGHGAYDIIKVASLIEAEAKVPQDRPLIASVIYNRLAANMPLQIDSTVIYARGNPADRTLSHARSPDQVAVQHVPAHRACRRRRSASVSDASLQRGDAPGADRLPLLRARRQGRPPRVRVARYEQQQQNIAAAQNGRPAVITGATRVAGVIGDPVRHSLSPRAAQRGVPRARSRLGLRRVRGSRRRRARPRSTRCARSVSSGCR